VLVLATLWPQFWDGLTARLTGGTDPHAQARELLAGYDIPVPAAFTASQLQRLTGAGDARLAQAATAAQDRQVIQFLAGAPELLARYRNAPPAAAALIYAAMDARRLGMGDPSSNRGKSNEPIDLGVLEPIVAVRTAEGARFGHRLGRRPVGQVLLPLQYRHQRQPRRRPGRTARSPNADANSPSSSH
jgi:hypothetical protein